MLKKFSAGCVKLVNEFLPDPFIFALLLSTIVYIAGCLVGGQTPLGMIVHWGQGFWSLLGFSMEMVLCVVLGSALANAPIFKRILRRLAEIPKGPKSAVAFVTIVTGVAMMIQWGFGLVIGAIFAKEVAKKVKGVDYRLIVGASYSTYILTVLTNSIPLKAATGGDDLVAATNGVLTEAIPMTQTAYFPLTLAVIIILFITLPILNAMMHPAPKDTVVIDPSLLVDEEEEAPKSKKNMTIAEKLENSMLISVIVFIAGAVYTIYFFKTNGFNLGIDIINFIMFMLGILLHKTPTAYIKAIGEAVKTGSGVILQFPFYAGIMGMMTGANADGVSLASVISNAFVSVANVHTFPIFSFLSAALVNMFVPSAGGQWAVQAPVMFPAAQALGVPANLTTMSICWGDAWTNLIQPFWALPVLGIAHLGVRDIMGYCVVALIWSGILIIASLLIWSFFFI